MKIPYDILVKNPGKMNKCEVIGKILCYILGFCNARVFKE
jgi:hypothetical protein